MGLCDDVPDGVNPSDNTGSGGRYNMQSVLPGDTLRIATGVLEFGGDVLDADACSVLFALSDQLFDDPLIELLHVPDEYAIDEYDNTAWVAADEGSMHIENGVVTVTLNPVFTETLRRGSFIYSIRATDLATGVTTTLFEGSVLVKYSPTSAHRSIPYKTVRITDNHVTDNEEES